MTTKRFFLKGSMATFLLPVFMMVFLSFLFSCKFNQYETGDGAYSYLRADFVEIHTIDSQRVDYFINDEGEKLSFSNPYTVQWAEKKDTLYRALLYYNRKPDGIEPVKIQRVHVLFPLLADSVKSPKTDPVTLESAWTSDCQRTFALNDHQGARYLNVSFAVKTGQHDEKLVQSIGVMSENRNDTLRLTLLHDQGGIPEYYSSHVYASIPLLSSQSDATQVFSHPIVFTVHTYQGIVTKSY